MFSQKTSSSKVVSGNMDTSGVVVNFCLGERLPPQSSLLSLAPSGLSTFLPVPLTPSILFPFLPPPSTFRNPSSPVFPSLHPLRKRRVRWSSRKNFEILDSCRWALVHFGMKKWFGNVCFRSQCQSDVRTVNIQCSAIPPRSIYGDVVPQPLHPWPTHTQTLTPDQLLYLNH